jgi:hypothetical protein
MCGLPEIFSQPVNGLMMEAVHLDLFKSNYLMKARIGNDRNTFSWQYRAVSRRGLGRTAAFDPKPTSGRTVVATSARRPPLRQVKDVCHWCSYK